MSKAGSMNLNHLREEIAAIIERGRQEGLDSGSIVDAIFEKALLDRDFVVRDGKAGERPVTIHDIILLADKALRQANFEGGIAVLQSGSSISLKNHPDMKVGNQ